MTTTAQRVAAALSPAMAAILREAAGGYLLRDELAYPRRSYLRGGGGSVTGTVAALHRRRLITPGVRESEQRYSAWAVTELGGQVLARLAADRGDAPTQSLAGFGLALAFAAFVLAACGNWGW